MLRLQQDYQCSKWPALWQDTKLARGGKENLSPQELPPPPVPETSPETCWWPVYLPLMVACSFPACSNTPQSSKESVPVACLVWEDLISWGGSKKTCSRDIAGLGLTMHSNFPRASVLLPCRSLPLAKFPYRIQHRPLWHHCIGTGEFCLDWDTQDDQKT